VNISSVAVRIRLQTENARNASTKFRKTSESEKMPHLQQMGREESLEISAFSIQFAGYSPLAKIRSPCALQASLQIFGRRMRTDAAFAAQFASSPSQPTEKPPLRVAFLL